MRTDSEPVTQSLVKPQRTAEIEEFMRNRPDKVRRLPPAEVDRDTQRVEETRDKNQIGVTWGAYRRRKHRGSDDQ